MKISDFIEYLTSIKEEHGDLEVCTSYYNEKYDELEYEPIKDFDDIMGCPIHDDTIISIDT